MKRTLVLALLAAGAVASGAALAHGRVHFGIGIGIGPYWGPYWGPAYYPAPLYYPAPYYYPAAPAVLAAPPAPAQYVERPDQQYQSGYWYYCEVSRGYYPYVKSCPSGWKAVPPAPPPAQ